MERPTRAGLIGKLLLWVIGIPLLVILFAMAAVARGLVGTPSDRADDRQAQPPAIYQPKGPAEPPQRHSGGIER